MSNANAQIKKIDKELAEARQIKNKKEEWQKNITDVFEKLDPTLIYINKEKKRLQRLFICFSAGLIVSIVAAIAYVVYLSFCYVPVEPFSFSSYSFKFLPVTLCVAVIWVSIVQMNRAQRQLMALAHFEHEVKYIEGLLLALNTLSPNLDETVKTINEAIEKLLDKHIDKKQNHTLDESIIKDLDNKDFIPIDLVKEILGVLKK